MTTTSSLQFFPQNKVWTIKLDCSDLESGNFYEGKLFNISLAIPKCQTEMTKDVQPIQGQPFLLLKKVSGTAPLVADPRT